MHIVGKGPVKDESPRLVFLDCYLHYSVGIDLPADLPTKTSTADLGAIVQPSLIASHRQSQQSNPRIAPKIEPYATLPPSYANTASLNSPTNTQSTCSPTMPRNMPIGVQQTGTPHRKLPSNMQGIQQPQKQCSQHRDGGDNYRLPQRFLSILHRVS